MYSGEHCDNCGMPVAFFTRSYWNADDELWARVIGNDHTILCPPCFTEAARRAGIGIHWKALEGV